MSLFNKNEDTRLSSVMDISFYVIMGGVSGFAIATSLNDIYCFNILKNQQYKQKNLYCRYYHARYTKLFISGVTIIGLLGGGLYSYYKKPLIYLIS
tara:strand:- start:485 stop:772 length:288 start_codon:yes stop_codon:yes gene_type:complete